MADRLFFSFADLDWNDDEAVAARVQQVWEHATAALTKENPMTNRQTTPTVTLGPKYAEAVSYAAQLHTTETRKTTNIPYISHLLGASSLVLETGGDVDMAIAALLHDGPEDQGGQATLDEIRNRFGDRVAHIVEGCTDSLAEDPENKAPWKERKIAYLAHLKQADEDTVTVSLADKLHNARAIVTDLMIHGDSTWERLTGKKDRTIWYYESILDIARASNAPEFLKANLQDVVAGMLEATH